MAGVAEPAGAAGVVVVSVLGGVVEAALSPPGLAVASSFPLASGFAGPAAVAVDAVPAVPAVPAGPAGVGGGVDGGAGAAGVAGFGGGGSPAS